MIRSQRRSRSGHLGCLIELFVLTILLWLSVPLVKAVRNHVVELGDWSLVAMTAILAPLVLYVVAACRGAGVWDRWFRRTIFAWISICLLANGLVLACDWRLSAATFWLVPAVLLGGFWALCAGVVALGKRMEKKYEQTR